MCQNNSNSNINVYPLAIADRDQKFMPTYSRTKKARKTSTTSSISYDSMGLPTSDTDISSHCENCTQANCDLFPKWEKNVRQNSCDKELSMLNMDQSSCILTNSLSRCHKTDAHSNESHRICNNGQPNVRLENTQSANMVKGQQQQQQQQLQHSHKRDHAAYRHRTTLKTLGSSSKFCGARNASQSIVRIIII